MWGGAFSIFSIPKLSHADDAGVTRELLSANRVPSGTVRLNRVRDKVMLVYLSPMSMLRNVGRVLVFAVPMALCLPFGIVYLRPYGVSPLLLGVAYAIVIGLAMQLWVRRDFKRLNSRANEIVDAFLDEGICPCCAYNLAGVVRAPANALTVTCPECGASWKIERIHHLDEDETHAARETPSLNSILRAQASLYNSMAFHDDAGAKVAMARFSDLRELRARSEGEQRTRLDACIAALRFRGLWKRLLLASVVVPLTIGVIVELSRRPIASMGLMQLFQMMVMLMWLVGAAAILRSDIGRSGAKRAALLRSEGLCPACGNLLPLAVEGKATCAECRAVWNLSIGASGQQ